MRDGEKERKARAGGAAEASSERGKTGEKRKRRRRRNMQEKKSKKKQEQKKQHTTGERGNGIQNQKKTDTPRIVQQVLEVAQWRSRSSRARCGNQLIPLCAQRHVSSRVHGTDEGVEIMAAICAFEFKYQCGSR